MSKHFNSSRHILRPDPLHDWTNVFVCFFRHLIHWMLPDCRGGTAGMATMAMAIAPFGILWPLMALAMALFALCAVYTSLSSEYLTRLFFTFKFSIICLGNSFNCERSALNFLPLDSKSASRPSPSLCWRGFFNGLWVANGHSTFQSVPPPVPDCCSAVMFSVGISLATF